VIAWKRNSKDSYNDCMKKTPRLLYMGKANNYAIVCVAIVMM